MRLHILRRRVLVTTLAAISLAAVLSACGEGEADEAEGVASLDDGDDGGDGGDAEADGSQGRSIEDIDPEEIEELELEYAQCMRDEGVDFPDPGGEIPQEMYEDPDFETASATCQPILDEGFGDIELTPEMRAEMQDAMVAFAECMRAEGIDYPDPTFDDAGMPTAEMPEDWDPTSPEVQRAFEVCGEELAGLGEAP